MFENSFLSKFVRFSGKQLGAMLAFYWLAMATATHLPSDFPGVPGDGWDKLVHFSAFAMLAMLAGMAWRKARPLTFWGVIAIWIVIAVYAALDEWTQTFVGRYASVFDWLADAVGAAAGLSLFAVLQIKCSGDR